MISLAGLERIRITEVERVGDRAGAMRREVRAGLSSKPRSIAPKYFYDEAGSRLFDAICELPEYYLTRTERALLERFADDLVQSVRAEALIEIGSGMARKTGLLVRALCAHSERPLYLPFDIARESIEASARDLLPLDPRLRVHGIVGDFACDLQAIAPVAQPIQAPRLFAFLGSTIGNLDEVAAPALLRDITALLRDGDRLLLGIDLVKDAAVLHAAYNDARGVTAEFNKNVLRVLSRELDGDFDVEAFEHLAFYDAARERIEMHLVSSRRQVAVLRAIALSVELEEGERVLTEISRKFTRGSIERTFAEGGMRLERWLPSEDGAFALCVGRRA